MLKLLAVEKLEMFVNPVYEMPGARSIWFWVRSSALTFEELAEMAKGFGVEEDALDARAEWDFERAVGIRIMIAHYTVMADGSVYYRSGKGRRAQEYAKSAGQYDELGY